MLVAVALQTLLTFLQQNINVFENTLATTVNKFFINELVKLMMLWKNCVLNSTDQFMKRNQS